MVRDLAFRSDGGGGRGACDGRRGYDGLSGTFGGTLVGALVDVATEFRRNGRRGGDAGPAMCGQHAGGVQVWLSSGVADVSDKNSSTVIRVQGASATGMVDQTL